MVVGGITISSAMRAKHVAALLDYQEYERALQTSLEGAASNPLPTACLKMHRVAELELAQLVQHRKAMFVQASLLMKLSLAFFGLSAMCVIGLVRRRDGEDDENVVTPTVEKT
jgi:hypothetical protein